MKIAICDDEQIFIDILRAPLDAFFRDKDIAINTYEYTNGFTMLDEYLGYDIIFLDVAMPDIGGIELGKKIREIDKNVIIIYVTSEKERVFESFEVKAFGYIVKPVNILELTSTLNRATSEISSDEDLIAIEVQRKTHVKINKNNILYAETADRMINIYTTDKCYQSSIKLKELEQLLESDLFISPHRSYLINLKHVKEYDRSSITMNNSDKILVSRLKYNEFKKRFLEYLTQC